MPPFPAPEKAHALPESSRALSPLKVCARRCGLEAVGLNETVGYTSVALVARVYSYLEVRTGLLLPATLRLRFA